MKSDFERTAARAAVDAVEARWQRKHKQELMLSRRKRLRSILALLFLCMLVGGGAIAYSISQDGLEDGLVGPVKKFIANACGRYERVSKQSSGEGRAMVDLYAARLRVVVDAPVSLLRELPSQSHPKRAAEGAAYRALALDGTGGFRLFALTADGKGGLGAALCSPFGADRKLEWEVFRKLCRKPYLIEVGGAAYLCGSSNLKDAEAIKNVVLRSAGTSVEAAPPRPPASAK